MKKDALKDKLLNEIIQREEDRLFIVDRECYIIYTGTSASDERPFIRVGNYIDLPVEIIPQIENIVITDLLVGNPAFEQFNIDVRTLSHNRYIGSLPVVAKYLDFQKVFGLDLTNAKIVDVEKDIPFIQHKTELKDSNAFIGIFYTNGNFKIHHKNVFLLDLLREIESSIDEKKLMDRLVGSTRQSRRYEGEGVVFVGKTPFFYKNGNFICYHFPRHFLEDFARLSIDPTQIYEIIHPSANFIHISRLLRWKHSTSGRLLVITNHREQFAYMQKLFSKAMLSRKDFNGISYDSPNGISIANSGENFNITIRFMRTKPHRRDLVLAYIKGSQGIARAVKIKQDGIIVPSSIYEEYPTILRSANIPLLVFADTNFSQKSLRDSSLVLLQPGVQYEFRKYNSLDEIRADVEKMIGKFFDYAKSSPAELERAVKEKVTQQKNNSLIAEEYADVKNFISACRIALEEEKDRRKAAALRNAISELAFAGSRIIDKNYASCFRIIIAFCDNKVFEFVELFNRKTPTCSIACEEISEQSLLRIDEVADDSEKEFLRRIIRDRERLKKLLELLQQPSSKKNLTELSGALQERREYFYTEEPSIDFRLDVKKPSGIFIKKVIASVLVAISSAYIIYSSVRLYHKDLEFRADAIKKQEEQARKRIIEKYRIEISAREIFTFANKIALENGYRPITYKGLKEKNPNWIYPGNTFTIEKEIIVVKEGDTLWDIAHQKLLERNINFYRIYEELQKLPKESTAFFEKYSRAKNAAYSDAHKNALRELYHGPTASGKR
ncbi:MAG: LysM peptidoglycan-binding domain-containing protein [Spirochaetes bacterium]|nr:LysM peptidoglycan-binding domain-containing protein [Spirochaetota bacterium]